MSYYVRLMLSIIFLAMLVPTFGLGVKWIATNILSNFWCYALIILFTISTCIVAELIIGFLFNGV